ncbi:MAG: hypothetical protein ACO2ZJ_10900, partial [Pseudohongiellaceae bacterium]
IKFRKTLDAGPSILIRSIVHITIGRNIYRMTLFAFLKESTIAPPGQLRTVDLIFQMGVVWQLNRLAMILNF